MAISELFANTRAVDTTEWSLAANNSYDTGDAQTTDGVIQVYLDVSDMVLGDVLQIRFYEKARSGDTQRVVQEWILRDVQGSGVWVSPSFIVMHGWDWSLDALAGTITVNWSIRSVA